ncbi:MAG: hypothetical protein JW959_08085 [Pirellulales bacterium]|nr:hypothetical protein [Pirellulales bacterium]
MTSRELVVRTLNHEPVPRVPRDLWISPEVESSRADEAAEMSVRYPSDIVAPRTAPSPRKQSGAKTVKRKQWTDAWGCVWRDSNNGDSPELIRSPLAEAERFDSFQPPAELFDRSRFNRANKLCPDTDRFVLAWSEVRPFDRLRFLRGGEAATIELARGNKEIRGLLAALHEAACEELRRWAETEVDGVAFRDDWATPDGLLIAPEMWRELFRPLYKEYCKILHDGDKFVFFHGAGNIRDIFGDLVKLSVDAIHSQLHLMAFDRLVKRYRGRVTFWGGHPDARLLREPGCVDAFREAVLSTRRELDFGAGGVIAQCEWTPEVKLQTVAAFFEQWLVPMPMHA